MEKRTPHCRLTVVQALVAAGKVRMTLSAVTFVDDVLVVSFKEL